MSYSKWNTILGWACGIVATAVYIMTTERYASWWDTGEFIASAYKLQIVHQPGAPLFLIIQNLFSNLGFGQSDQIAFWMNVGSAVCSGLTIVFLFWTITALARKVMMPKESSSKSAAFMVFGAGLTGALAYAFTDTFWYSAVESEVYAMSSLCTAAVFWLILKWEVRADESGADRWLIVIAYVMGLSIGIHLLNLLTIPALALVVYFKKTPKFKWSGVLKAFLCGTGILALILWGVIQYSVKTAAMFDLYFVNSLALPFGSGIALFALLLIGGLILGIRYAVRKQKVYIHTALLGLCFVLFGYSSFALLPIRAATDIALNNNAPDDAFSFYGYLTREQYPKEPLFTGPLYSSQYVDTKEQMSYRKDSDRYTKIKGSSEYKYDKEIFFPRIWSERHASFYQDYLNKGENETPTYADNLGFFFSYQLGHMYWRYFMWNFAGRQNDQPGHATLTEGNWLSGIKPLDQVRLGGQQELSADFLKDPSRNTYFFLPLVLGVLGVIWHFKKSKQDASIVGLLFFFTGVAIVIYLNQSPLQPRERDYAYAGSFYMFSVWVGIGVLALYDLMRRYATHKIVPAVALGLGVVFGPVILIIENWNDHDRSQRSMSRDVAHNYLESCEPNAILFTYGDNDTFPLWYLQEVEGVRRDVRVVNLSYLQSEWYVAQMMRDQVDLKKLPIDLPADKIAKGVRDGIMFVDMNVPGHTDIRTLLDIMLSDRDSNKVQLRSGEFVNVLPTKKFKFDIDKEAVIRNHQVPQGWEEYVPETIEWTYSKNYVSRAELSLMSLLIENNWEQPVYFTSTMPNENYMGLDKYMVSEGLVKRMVPVDMGQPADQSTLVNKDTLYKNITQKFRWGNMSRQQHFDTDSKFVYENFVLPDVFGSTLHHLMENNEVDKAKEVALIAYNEMPKVSSMKQVYHNGVVVDTLFKSKEVEKGGLLAEKNIAFLEQELKYKTAVYEQKGQPDVQNIRLGLAAISMYKEILQSTQNEKLLTKLGALEQEYFTKYEVPREEG